MKLFLYLLVVIFSFSCAEWSNTSTNNFPNYPKEVGNPLPFPADNLPNNARLSLGEKLFFDPILSRDSIISCAKCHKRQNSFADNTSFSFGFKGQVGSRNSPVLVNLAWQPYFLSEGGVPSLEKVFLVPFHEESEMNSLMSIVLERINSNAQYKKLMQEAYPEREIPFAISRSLAVYMRSLVSYNSKFDKYYFQKNDQMFTEEEKNGWKLFQKVGCISCHSLPNFTDYKFYNIGIAEKIREEGKFRNDSDSSSFGAFKVPTLRNIGFSAPYMHNGSINTLNDAIEHYNKGGENNKFKSLKIKPLGLSEIEKKELLHFLKTLNDTSFTSY